MPSKAQQDTRRRRLARERKARWRAGQPKPAPSDGQEQFDLEAYTPPVIEQPARTCKQCQLAATFSNNNGWYCHEHGKAAAPVLAADPKAGPAEEILPLLPRPDPLLFDRASDKYRPAWVREMDPHPQPIRLAADPRAAYRFGAGLIQHQAAEATKEQEAERAAIAKSQDRRAWKPGQTEEEL
jgi:hypothetical protein